jgi:hypothetical protein
MKKTKKHAPSGDRCVICNRVLKEGNGVQVPGVGLTGSECRRRAAPLSDFLNTLTRTVDGLYLMNADESGIGNAALRALSLLGIDYRVAAVHVNGREVKVIELTGKRKAMSSKVVQTWEERRAEFEDSLKRAAALRETQPQPKIEAEAA